LDSIDAQTRTGRDIHGVDWDQIPQFKGISRVADNPQALLLTFNFTPSDQQMRRLYEGLMGWTAE
jgi:hypothetical protein